MTQHDDQATVASEPSAAGRTVERRVTIGTSPDIVWKALTDAEELMRWFPLEARVTPGEGGAIWMSWKELYTGTARIDVWDPPRRLSTRFPAHPPYELCTDYYLEAEGGATVLRVVTSGFGQSEDWDELYAGVRAGWDFELWGLKHYLERHIGERRGVAWARTPFAGPPSEAWRRMLGPASFLGAGLSEPAAGQPFETTTITGDLLVGCVQSVEPLRQIVGTIDSFADGLFRVEIDQHADPLQVVVWLTTYGVPEPILDAISTRWRRALPAVLGAKQT